jgi:stage II sporulation protein D
MRGRLTLFIALLCTGGFVFSWKLSKAPVAFLDGKNFSRELLTVPQYSDPARILPRQVRVNLSSAPVHQIEFAVEGPYIFRSIDTGEVLAKGSSLGRTLVSIAGAGFRMREQEFPATQLEVASERAPAIWVGDHQYRGKVRFARQSGDGMLVINILPLEDYIACVVDAEMPAAFPEAARLAQAIAARTYAVFQIDTSGGDPRFDVYATTRSQNYLGSQYRGRQGRRFAGESESSRQVAEQTAGMVCLCDKEIFCTYYTAVCGGRTASGREVFSDGTRALKSVPCEWCQDAKLYRWRTVVPLSQAAECMRRYFRSKGKRFDKLLSIRLTNDPKTAGLSVFEVNDGKRRERISAIDLRRLFQGPVVHSFQFDVHVAEKKLIFEGRGHGHGVGLCQWGARGMALHGVGPLDILRHYYPGTEIVVLQ